MILEKTSHDMFGKARAKALGLLRVVQRVANLGRMLRRGADMFKSDSLFRNATYLMASTAITAVLGFGFWYFTARLYTAADIGIASALISISLLISNVSMLGLNYGLIRFLPHSKNQSRDINAALIVVGSAASTAALVYLAAYRLFGYKVEIFTSLWSWPVFAVLMAAVAINTLTDSVFIANRRAEYHTVTYASLGLVKLVTPLLLVPLGSIGVFAAYIASVVVSLGLSFYLMWRKTGYVLRSKPNWPVIKKTQHFATSNYISNFFSGLPSQALPTIILVSLGATQSAFFAMSLSMANLLYVIPSSFAKSLLAESSHDLSMQKSHLKEAVRILTIVLIPTIVVAIVLAPYVLGIFGAQYAKGGTLLFQIMAISTASVTINLVMQTVLSIQLRPFVIVPGQLALAIVTLIMTWLLLPLGLAGIGLALLAGNVAANLVYAWEFARSGWRDGDLPNWTSEPELEPILAQYNISKFKATPLTEGRPNRTYLIESERGKSVLRVYHPTYRTRDNVDFEMRFLAHLAKHHIPVTRVILNKNGNPMTEANANGQMLASILMEYSTGQHVTNLSDSVVRDLATTQARIHLVGAIFDNDKHQIPDPLDFARKALRKFLLFSHSPHGVSHFDYNQNNVLVDQGRVVLVLDFEGLRRDSFVICLAYTLASIYKAHRDIRLLSDYVGYYQTVRKLNRLERLLLRTSLAMSLRSPRMLTVRY